MIRPFMMSSSLTSSDGLSDSTEMKLPYTPPNLGDDILLNIASPQDGLP